MSAPITRTVRMRLCAADGCDVRFDPDARDVPYPRRYCSAACYYADRPKAERKARAPLRQTATAPKRRPISPASPEQREATRERACLVDPTHGIGCDPAHLVSRGELGAGQDDPLAVVALCRSCHDLYDGRVPGAPPLDLLPHLEPHGRDALAFAVGRFGLIRTLERVTGVRWSPVESDEAAEAC